MTVLLVDDQISILSGLMSGLDWDALGITSVRTAGNAIQAREILEKERIDVLLCDIEMPGENGLSLLRWARRQGMDFVCIFLTSHADFMYAKEAIKLNCFDYILQPARYEDIQSTVAKAIQRVKKEHAEKELEQYGTLAKLHTPGLLQNLFSDWAAGKTLSISALRDVLRRLGKEVTPATDCFSIWGHILRWHTLPWPAQEWNFALNNIVTEVYEEKHYGILSFTIDSTSMGWLIYAPNGRFTDPDTVLEPLSRAYPIISGHMHCDIAFYCSPAVPLNQLNTLSEGLLQAKRDNVLQTSGIFSTGTADSQPHFARYADNLQIRRWENLLAEGDGQTVCEEVYHFFDDAIKKKQVNHRFLHIFWVQFQQIILNALNTPGRELQKILPLLERGENARSLPEMREVVKETTHYFQSEESSCGNEKNAVERAKIYLENHIDQPLSAADVAAALFMNADYLSRLFKNECGITLKEYILKIKMESARNLLQTTALPVSVIASKLGYDNFSYFSQAYRRVMGVSPTDERKD